jgi:reactive chlorine resistance protein C
MATGSSTRDAVLAAKVKERHILASDNRSASSRIEVVGRELARYGLVVVVGWIGLMKFTGYEAEGIRPFVANSPLMSWVYGLMSVRAFSAVLGVVEIAIAILIAARWFSPRIAALGSALAVAMFLTTLSFLVTTPGVWEPSLGGFPALSAIPGQFLVKDLALLGVSLWLLGEAWRASERTTT